MEIIQLYMDWNVRYCYSIIGEIFITRNRFRSRASATELSIWNFDTQLPSHENLDFCEKLSALKIYLYNENHDYLRCLKYHWKTVIFSFEFLWESLNLHRSISLTLKKFRNNFCNFDDFFHPNLNVNKKVKALHMIHCLNNCVVYDIWSSTLGLAES